MIQKCYQVRKLSLRKAPIWPTCYRKLFIMSCLNQLETRALANLLAVNYLTKVGSTK